MARESSLWQRCKRAGIQLLAGGHLVHLGRIENSAGSGNPDVDGCIDATQVWIELKSCVRPARASTLIRPKLRDSQRDWHRDRSAAGCRTNWVLLQVGESGNSKLYLVAGRDYDQLIAPEVELELISWCDPAASVAEVLVRATHGWT